MQKVEAMALVLMVREVIPLERRLSLPVKHSMSVLVVEAHAEIMHQIPRDIMVEDILKPRKTQRFGMVGLLLVVVLRTSLRQTEVY